MNKEVRTGVKGLVSVVIPMWNTGEAAERVVRQLLRYEMLEVVVVDDGSTDDSLARMRKVEKEFAGRVKVLTQENRGAAAARNAGMRVAKGEYLVFVDSDDEVEEGFVPELVKAMEECPGRMMAVTGVKYRRLADGTESDAFVRPVRARSKGEKLAYYVLSLLLVDGRLHSAANKIFRADVVRRHKLEFEAGRDFAEDTHFVLSYLKYAARDILANKDYPSGDISGERNYSCGDIWFIDQPLYIYNFGTETSTVKTSGLKWENWEKSYRDLKKWAEEVDGKLGVKTRVLLLLVKARWRVAHYRAVKRAQTL